MSVCELIDLPPRGALLGLDPGTKTIGVAASDGGRLIASPVETIPKGKKLAPALARLWEIVDEREAAGLVVGLPKNMDGSEGPRAQSVRAFARNVLAGRDVPLAFWDERLSTAAVERTLLEADASRARRGEVVDKLAAAYILQGALDLLAEIDH
ncbi:MAG: Holliday junction resolvase RuvX [Pseudomonadota bacterium]